MTISGIFFWQLHKHLSKYLGANCHFGVLNLSKSQLDKKLQDKTQTFQYPLFKNFEGKNPEHL